MPLLTVLIPVNKHPQLNDAFTIQCKKICETLSKKIELKIIWVMFPSIPAYEKSDLTSINHDVLFFNKSDNLVKLFKNIKPDIVFINGSLDFHNVTTNLVSKSLKIPVFSLFFRNPYVVKLSSVSALNARFSGLTTKYTDNTKKSKPTRLFTIKFYFNQFHSLYSTLKSLKFTKIQSFSFILKYVKIISIDVNPADQIISGNLNFCNVEQMKQVLLDSNFVDSSISIVGDPYFDNQNIINEKTISEKKSEKYSILFCPSPNHEHGLCSMNKEFNLIIDTINIIQKNDIEIALKIHPSSSRIDEYVTMLKGKISKPIHIFQSENLTDLFDNYDIMLTYGGTGAMHDAVLLGKPIVNLDIDKKLTGQPIHYDDKIITHCKNLDSLIQDIQISYEKIITPKDIESFFQKYLGYSKIKPSVKISDIILSFIK
jgi:hypothetical protein|tara:strand:- start:1300 stop:2583 length:1284 start_codon:yes stop_codon:yes gene_type:complete